MLVGRGQWLNVFPSIVDISNPRSKASVLYVGITKLDTGSRSPCTD